MNRDVHGSVSEMESRREAERAARADFTAAWRRLKAYRDGLRREIAERAPSRLQENPEAIYEEMMSKGMYALQAAAATAKEATDALERHVSGATAMGKLSPAWRAERARLEAVADDRVELRKSLSALRDTAKDGARRWSVQVAMENRLTNERKFQPISPLVSRLEGVERALAAIDAGDPKVMACLQRWDIDALVKVAFLWGKLRQWGTLSETDNLYYMSAGVPAVAPTESETAPKAAAISDEGEVVRMTLSPGGALSGSVKSDYGGYRAGTALGGLAVLELAGVLGSLRMDGLSFDGDLVETFLDARFPSWRETVADSMRGGDGGPGAPQAPEPESPYDILGVTPGMSLAEISKVFAMTMNAVQNLPNAAPQRRLIAAFKDVRKLKEAAAPGNGP